MKYLDEYRDADAARRYADAIRARVTRPWTLMEVCGGQTHAIVRFGIDQLLPPALTLLHGPGCPVCVTPVGVLDAAMAIAARPEVTLCSFGDMLRVPGSTQDLFAVKSAGGDVRVVYSPMDAVGLAAADPTRQVVFLAVGFETTAPANAMAVRVAHQRGVTNFSMLVSHVRVPPALRALLADPEHTVNAFLAAGHVCAVMGVDEYVPIAREHRVPIVVTGFEPLDILQGIHMAVAQLEDGRAEVENQYARAVRAGGNLTAQRVVAEVFEVGEQTWRGLGAIAESGLRLRGEYARYDAALRFALPAARGREDPTCVAGRVLTGRTKPEACPAFGTRCTPETPLGATMVSAEGACAAYYRYRRVGAP